MFQATIPAAASPITAAPARARRVLKSCYRAPRRRHFGTRLPTASVTLTIDMAATIIHGMFEAVAAGITAPPIPAAIPLLKFPYIFPLYFFLTSTH